MHARLDSQRGAGLVETLLVVVFISISIISLIRFQHFLSASTHQTQQQNDAIIIATKKIENLRDYAVIPTTAGYAAYQDIASGSSTSTQNGTSFTTAWTVTSTTNPTYKTLDVSVTWTDRNNTSRSIRLITRVTSLDPSTSALIMNT